MNAPLKRGWCPSLFEPMAAGDGFLVRVKPRVDGVRAAQLRALADAADSFGSGRVEITNRGNFQLRGLATEALPRVADAMLAADLASADRAAERRRNILVAVSADAAMIEIARRLQVWLEREDGLDALPDKFGFAVGAVMGDISLLPGEMPMVVLPGGFAALAAEPVAAMQALTQSFLRRAGLGRMAALVSEMGAPAVFAEAGLQIHGIVPPADTMPPVGKLPDAFGLGLPFGVQDGRTLRAAADLADRFGNGWLRTTQARSLVVMGTGDDVRGVAVAARASGFVTEAEDMRLRVVACAGLPACSQAHVDARAVAARLAPLWAAPGLLHVSGCAKGCAAPSGAAVTLVAAGQTYDVVRNGRARDVPEIAGLAFAAALEWMREKRLCR